MNITGSEIVRANLDVHEKEAEYYDELHKEITNFYQRYRFQKFLKTIVAQLPDSKLPYVLEIGSGTGFLTLQLLKRGFHVHAVELSPIMVNILNRKIQTHSSRQQCKIYNSDINSFLENGIDRRDKYHLICMNSVLHHLPDYLNTVDNLLEFVDHKGVLFISHEPLSPVLLNRVYWNMQKIDMKIWSSFLSMRLKEGTKDIDYSLADIHAQHGIIPETVVKVAENRGFECLVLEKYCAQLKSGFLSWLANNLPLGNDHFRLAFKESDIK